MSDNPTTIHSEIRSKESSSTGYLITILLFLFLQTGAAFYWAGGVSRSQESAKDEIKQLQGTVETLRNQYQVLSMQISEMQGKQDSNNDLKKLKGSR